jgi:hypothetical protein
MTLPPICCQAPMPPLSAAVRVYPFSLSFSAARALVASAAQVQ